MNLMKSRILTKFKTMSKKNKPDTRDLFIALIPIFHLKKNSQNVETLLPAQQKLKVRLDTKHRAGKAVTLIEGFIGNEEDLEELGKKLKGFCGTGGSAKDGEIIVQGDQREKVVQWLIKTGYKQSKKI